MIALYSSRSASPTASRNSSADLVMLVDVIAHDLARRDRRHEDVDHALAFERRLQVLDVGLQRLLADIVHRPGAQHRRRPRAGMAVRIEFGERALLARVDLRRVVVARLHAAEPFMDVRDEAGLGLLAVIDDIEAGRDLAADDVVHRLAHGLGNRPANACRRRPSCGTARRAGAGTRHGW